VKGFSGGMKRRLNMAAGLVHRPSIVLLDEPTVGVDPQSRERIFAMIEALRAAGTTVLYTTHYMEEAERLCDRIAIVDRGRVVALGTRDALVRAAFGTACDVTVELPGPPPPEAAAWVEAAGGRCDGARLRFSVADPARALPEILAGARERGLEIRDLRLRAPGLEAVFLKLTGRELRE
jgi:ABC-2 type transport system ATP-binding protein